MELPIKGFLELAILIFPALIGGIAAYIKFIKQVDKLTLVNELNFKLLEEQIKANKNEYHELRKESNEMRQQLLLAQKDIEFIKDKINRL